uniref:StAR-related lipid transfer protein 13 n=1 Tax=Parascaris univalens TaxID=6257 RepID=A0A915BP43_PARUN
MNRSLSVVLLRDFCVANDFVHLRSINVYQCVCIYDQQSCKNSILCSFILLLRDSLCAPQILSSDYQHIGDAHHHYY